MNSADNKRLGRNAKITYKLKCKKNYLFVFLSMTVLLNTYFVNLLGKIILGLAWG